MPNADAIAFLKRTQEITAVDVEQGKNVWHMIASTNSELGEFGDELLIEEGVPGHGHKEVDEGTQGEAVDVVICALALYFIRGGTVENLIAYGNKKLTKWAESQKS